MRRTTNHSVIPEKLLKPATNHSLSNRFEVTNSPQQNSPLVERYLGKASADNDELNRGSNKKVEVAGSNPAQGFSFHSHHLLSSLYQAFTLRYYFKPTSSIVNSLV